MEKSKNLKRFFAVAAIAAASVTTGFGQTDLGADCGCPPVASRPKVLLSTMADNGGATDGELSATNVNLTCDKSYVLDKKIYVANGRTLTIQPGTVIYGRAQADPANATALIVERGAKIFAVGQPDCQIVFTAEADPMDGSYPIKNKGQWGGLVIAGKASNNLTLAKNGPFTPGQGDGKLCVADGLGTFEGFATSDTRDHYGVNLTAGESFDDNDNSGILKYVSVRFSGAVLQVGGEINGISLGSVGRGTTIDHIDVISCADDNMEFFGGTVNVKYATFMFCDDDGFDWDDGYSGKVQFVFVVKSSTNDTTVTSPNSDNGFEMDADDQQSGLFPRSHPVIYNCTMIGNNKHVMTSDNTGMAAINAKELTEGEIYNSVFANFEVGLNVLTGNKPGEGTRVATSDNHGHSVVDTYDNWIYGNLIIKNNTFVNCLAPLALDCHKKTTTYLADSYIGNPASHAPSASDLTKFNTTDGNIAVANVSGLVWNWSMDGTSNAVTTQFSPIPSPALSTNITAPQDGFFTPATYRGAFDPNKQPWLSPWAYATLLENMPGLQECPTDINGDGTTNNVDFLQLLGKFNQNCK